MNNTNNSAISFGVGGIIIGLFFGMLINPMMWYSGMMFWSANQTSNQQIVGVRSIDQHFIEQMIPHHQGAIDMANLALQKASHPEIKNLAEAIVKAQTAENQEMRTWYRDWFGVNVPEQNFVSGGMMFQGGMHMGGSQDIDALRNASDFDQEFIEQMIPHHQMAIMMARMLASGTSRPEMQQLAKNIITSQSEEIQQMQAWYTSWYQ